MFAAAIAGAQGSIDRRGRPVVLFATGASTGASTGERRGVPLVVLILLCLLSYAPKLDVSLPTVEDDIGAIETPLVARNKLHRQERAMQVVECIQHAKQGGLVRQPTGQDHCRLPVCFITGHKCHAAKTVGPRLGHVTPKSDALRGRHIELGSGFGWFHHGFCTP